MSTASTASDDRAKYEGTYSTWSAYGETIMCWSSEVSNYLYSGILSDANIRAFRAAAAACVINDETRKTRQMCDTALSSLSTIVKVCDGQFPAFKEIMESLPQYTAQLVQEQKLREPSIYAPATDSSPLFRQAYTIAEAIRRLSACINNFMKEDGVWTWSDNLNAAYAFKFADLHYRADNFACTSFEGTYRDLVQFRNRINRLLM